MASEFPILLCTQPVSGSLSAADAAAAVKDGLAVTGRAFDVLELPTSGDRNALLNAASFDQRMRAAFAVVILTENLSEEHLRASIAAEIATRARQAGVACHAICGESSLEPFSARIYDLQTVQVADDAAGFTAAGRRLADLL
ncbi:MAG TPA: hypothetical protein VNT22_08915 [Baekduia sp.]|nr:hypothetical protein [Baekduia sp.]